METIKASQFIELHHKGNNELVLINKDNITSVAIADGDTRINLTNEHYILVDEDYLTVKGKLVDNVVISVDELLT